MSRFSLRAAAVAFASLIITTPAAFAVDPLRPGLVAHEWGTFTTVASETGYAVRWRPLASADLPCFVERFGPFQVKSRLATAVRMETPVLYFYSPRPANLSVRVDFPQGLITEWYPKASSVAPSQTPSYAHGGRIEWNNIELLPATSSVTLPSTKGESHYYPARNTDAAPLRVNGQLEKMLFYRGVADFDVPVQAQFDAAGRLHLRNTGTAPLPVAIYFENRGGKIGYRAVRDFSGSVDWDAPSATGIKDVQQALAAELVRAGLYPKEAAAMIDTWRDSWFEAGTRVFYLVPRKLVDSVLPLHVEPPPALVERVFVGRMEVLAPWMAAELPNVTDPNALFALGRFLDPFAEQSFRSTGKRLNMSAYRAATQRIWDAAEKNGGCVH